MSEIKVPEGSRAELFLSMTGYGFNQYSDKNGVYRCEVRSVNSRYLEVQVRTGKPFLCLEPAIINLVKSQVERGKVDVFVECAPQKNDKGPLNIDEERLSSYLDLYGVVEKTVRHRGLTISPLDIRSLMNDFGWGNTQERGSLGPGYSVDPEVVQQSFQEGVLECLNRALLQHHQSRATEGNALAKSLSDPVGSLRAHLKHLTLQLGTIQASLKKIQNKRLDTAIEALGNQHDTQLLKSREERILIELALLADKQDISEEMARLGAHLDQVEGFLRVGTELREVGTGKPQKGGLGRKMDFLCQEMFREINTMSNKLIQIEVLEITIDMKQQVEKIRQQVQNIE